MVALGPHGGLVDLPCWSLRPGGVQLLQGAENAMPIWGLLRSINGLGCRPCEASESTLGETLAISRSTVRHRLEALRGIGNGALLLELKRPRRYGVRIPTIYRWAVNPFEIKRFVKIVCRSHLPRIAEERGLGRDWLSEANNQVDKHFAKARIFAEMLRDDLLSEPCINPIQNGKATVSRLRRNPRKRRSRYSRR